MENERKSPPESASAARHQPLGSDGEGDLYPDGSPTLDQPLTGQIEAAQAGTDGALGRLLAECRNYLLLVANREVEPCLQAKIAPSDLVQETLQDVLGKFDQFRGTTEAELRSWLTRILKSRYSSAVTRFQYTQKRDISREIPLHGSATGSRIGMEIADPDMTPGANAIAHENEQTVRRAMIRLSEDYRRVIELKNWQRLSFTEIGQQLNRSAEAARKLWTRAAEQLGKELEQLDDSR